MSEHEQTCALLADILSAQQETITAINKLTDALAGVRAAAVAEKAVAKAKESAAPAPVSTAEAPQQAEPAKAAVSADPTLDYAKDVAPFMSKILNEKGATVLKELLSRFGAKKGAELQTKDLALALEQAKEILNG